jgi:hypothetical protein
MCAEKSWDLKSFFETFISIFVSSIWSVLSAYCTYTLYTPIYIKEGNDIKLHGSLAWGRG